MAGIGQNDKRRSEQKQARGGNRPAGRPGTLKRVCRFQEATFWQDWPFWGSACPQDASLGDTGVTLPVAGMVLRAAGTIVGKAAVDDGFPVVAFGEGFQFPGLERVEGEVVARDPPAAAAFGDQADGDVLAELQDLVTNETVMGRFRVMQGTTAKAAFVDQGHGRD